MVDIAGSECRDPVSDIETLRTEIKLYDPELSKLDWLVVANKMDLDSAEDNLMHFRQRFPKIEVVPVSAKLEKGLESLREILCARVGERVGEHNQ